VLHKLKTYLTYYGIRMLRIKKGDHRIAIGFAIGFFHCWFPTFGIGLPLSIAMARLVRGNMPSAILASSLGSVLWPLLFYLNYWTGHLITTLFTSPSFDLDDVINEQMPEPDYVETIGHFSDITDIGLDFLIGSIINSILSTIILYFVCRVLVRRYRTPLLNLLRRK